jgi:cytochrome c
MMNRKTGHVKILLALTVLSVSAVAGADGNASAGEKLFTQCSACHAVGPEAQNSVGPVLNGVVGRPAGKYPGYRYSSAMRRSGLVWDEATLIQYLHGPDKVVPGTKMAFAGITSDEELADLVAYLKQQH